MYALAGRGNKFTPTFSRACLFLPSQKSWELFHFTTLRWQMPRQDQNHKHLSSTSFVFQHSLIRHFISTLPSIISPFCRYPVCRITVSNIISAAVDADSTLHSQRKRVRAYDKNIEYFIILSIFSFSKYKSAHSHPNLKLKIQYYKVLNYLLYHKSDVSIQMCKAIVMSL